MRVACTTLISPFPKSRFAAARSYLAFLQASVYHGANDFPHLFGFLGREILISFTTFASTACWRMYFSTAAALASLVKFSSDIKAVIPSRNAGEFVCACHVWADLEYSVIPYPSTHLKRISVSPTACVSRF